MKPKNILLAGVAGLALYLATRKSGANIITPFSDMRKSITYESLTDNSPPRTTEELVQIFKETNTEIVFRGHFWWNKIADSSFDIIKNSISNIKAKLSPKEIIFITGVPAMRLIETGETDEITGQIYTASECWNMALDPAKWGITSPTKQEIQDAWHTEKPAWGYLSDISNPNFQKLLIHRAERFINAGYDAIWLDVLHKQIEKIIAIIKDWNHPSIQELIQAEFYIFDEIKKLRTPTDKIPYIGSWLASSYIMPKYDFLIFSPKTIEVQNTSFDNIYWTNVRNTIHTIYPTSLPIVFIDDGGQMQYFAQQGHDFEIDFLTKLKQYFSPDFVIVYPIHGLKIYPILSYGIYNKYDAQAPEFNTYQEIVRLMNL